MEARPWSAQGPSLPPSPRQKLQEVDLELQRKREYIEELEPPSDSSSKRCSAAARLGGSRSGAWSSRTSCSPSSPADRRAAEQPAEERRRLAGHGGAVPPLCGQGAHGEDGESSPLFSCLGFHSLGLLPVCRSLSPNLNLSYPTRTFWAAMSCHI
jgi:hypothetical protein